MSKQVSFSAVISALTTALFALSVTAGGMQVSGSPAISAPAPLALTILAD